MESQPTSVGAPALELPLGRKALRLSAAALLSIWLAFNGAGVLVKSWNRPLVPIVAFFVLVIPLFFLMRRWLATPVVRIADDGIALGKGERFLPIDDILGSELRPASRSQKAGVVVQRNGDNPLLLAFPDGRHAKQAHERILAAMKHAQDRRADTLRALERSGRSVVEWKRDLAAAVARKDDFRSIGVDTEHAARILEDGAATSEQRIGAALALRASGFPQARVRVVAEATSDEPLRVALEKIATEEAAEEEIEAALSAEQQHRPI